MTALAAIAAITTAAATWYAAWHLRRGRTRRPPLARLADPAPLPGEPASFDAWEHELEDRP